MRVIGFDILPLPSKAVEYVDIDTVYKTSDVVSLHVPLTPLTQQMVNSKKLALMKRTAFIINTSRGPVIHEKDLADALNAGRIAGAGLDVLSIEPPSLENPLLKAKNCYITPHIAWATRSARQRLLDVSIDNVRAFLANKPVNVVNE